MKKLLIASLDFPPRVGGVAHFWKQVALSFSSLEHDVVFVTSEMNKDLELDDKVNLYRVPLLSSFIRPRWIQAIVQFVKIIRKEKVGILLVDQVWPLGVVALLISRFKSLPYAVQIHGNDLLQVEKSRFKTVVLKSVLKKAAFISTNSSSTKSLVTKYVDEQKVIVVHPIPQQANRIDDKETNAFKKKHHLDNVPVILFVGRLVERKGAKQLLGAMNHVWQGVPNAQCVVIGNGPELEALQQMPQASDERVNILTSVGDEEKHFWYAAADVFVMPSLRFKDDIEGFGMVYLEAYAQATPVISGNAGGEVDAVEDGKSGLLVDATNIDELAMAILSLLQHPKQAREMGEYGLELLKTTYAWETQFKKLLHELEQL